MPAPAPVSALIDQSTTALLYLSHHIPVVTFLANAMAESEHWVCVNYPNYLAELPVAKMPPSMWPQQSWDHDKRIFEPTAGELVDERLKARSQLAIKKALAFSEIVRAITLARCGAAHGVPMQDVIYLAKRMQAQRFKDHNYNGNELDYPYLMQYAELAQLTPAAAADEILLKAAFTDDILIKSEYFRLKYLDRIKRSNDPEAAGCVITEFRREYFQNFDAHAL